jgi:hypothetical protein
MTRRKLMTGAAVGLAVVGFGALVGLAGHFGVLRDDDDDDDDKGEALSKVLRFSKSSLQQGLTTGEQEGQPIAGKFEIDRRKFQLSVYTVKDGKFFEVLVDPATGNVAKVESIIKAGDLAAAQSQNAAMANAKLSLKDAVDKATGEATDVRAVGVIPNLKEGRPVASVVLLKGKEFVIVQQRLD